MSSLRKHLSHQGQLQKLQISPQKDYFRLSKQQNYLYRKAIMGMKGVPNDLRLKLSHEQVREIEREARKVQKFLNLWKQELTISKSNALFQQLFPNTEFTRQLVEKYSKPSPKFCNTLEFEQLGVNKPMIIAKLIENKYLPNHFYEIKG